MLPQVIKESERVALNEEYMEYCTSLIPFPGTKLV